MELLESPKTIYLLEADCEVLHEESREWLNEIKFWRDEIAFFYTLMIKKSNGGVFSKTKEEVTVLLDEILHLSGKEFDSLENAIAKHENDLSLLLESNSIGQDRAFREEHKAISLRIKDFDKRFRKLKQEVFSLVKKE